VDVARRVLTDAERAALDGLTPEERDRTVRVAFALKEAIYKSIDPVCRRYVGFKEVELAGLSGLEPGEVVVRALSRPARAPCRSGPRGTPRKTPWGPPWSLRWRRPSPRTKTRWGARKTAAEARLIYVSTRPMGKATLLLITLLCCSACNVSTTRRKPIVEPEQAAHRGTTRTSVQYAHANDAPEISRGTGDAGTVVVLWPRVLPKTDDPKISDLAGRVQIRLDRLAAKTGKKVDRRPAPRARSAPRTRVARA
jgi:hypothetical protein